MSTPEFDPQATARGFAESWRRVMTDPRGFFATMPETGGLQEPLIFLVICAALNALGHALIGVALRPALAAFLWEMVFALLLAVVLVLVAQNLFDGRAGFEPTMRVVAYAAAPMVFLWLPGLGVLARLYSWYLLVRGLERVDAFDAPRAVLTVAVGVAVLFVVGLASAGGSWHAFPRG